MNTLRTLALCILLGGLPWIARSAPRPANESPAAGGLTLAVADFSGQDKELGRFLADTLLTDLAQSERLHLTERSEIRQALTELKLQATGLTEPQQVKKVGKLVGADRLIVGGYLVRDERMIINARLLDVRTGRVTPGGAANVAGPRADAFGLVHHLARVLHKRITGAELDLSTDAPSQSAVAMDRPTPPDAPTEDLDEFRKSGLIPRNARPNSPVSERDLASLVKRLARSGSIFATRGMAGKLTNRPVTRMRLIAALVKSFRSSSELAAYDGITNISLPPDRDAVPSWGLIYIAAAVDQDWLSPEQPARPNGTATWAFVGSLLAHLPQGDEPRPAHRREIATFDADPDACTGLIVDARDLPIERAMSVRILDEEGQVLYPDPRYIPDDDYLQDNGMASYIRRRAEAERAGSRPLIVEALRLSPTAGEDVVVSDRVAERIREENRRGRFLWRWKVCILTDNGR